MAERWLLLSLACWLVVPCALFILDWLMDRLVEAGRE